jgi:hypothetical protein
MQAMNRLALAALAASKIARPASLVDRHPELRERLTDDAIRTAKTPTTRMAHPLDLTALRARKLLQHFVELSDDVPPVQLNHEDLRPTDRARPVKRRQRRERVDLDLAAVERELLHAAQTRRTAGFPCA